VSALFSLPVTFAAPWVLLALAALPVLWWLLRVTPPPPRRESFPAIRLLAGLASEEETAARTPWWLLALRILAAALIILGLAQPVLNAGNGIPGTGPVLLVIDDGWAAASEWPRVTEAANSVLAQLSRSGRNAALFLTAPAAEPGASFASPLVPASELRSRLAGLTPKPWPVDRSAAAEALRAWKGKVSAAVYFSDGLDTPNVRVFAEALAGLGPVVEIRPDPPKARVLLPPADEKGQLVVRVGQVPGTDTLPAQVLAETADGRSLAEVSAVFPQGGGEARAVLPLPPELRNTLSELVLKSAASAGGHWLLDERWRRRPVGLLAGDLAGAEAPLLGELYYVHRALAPYAELREGTLESLLEQPLSVLVLTDRVVNPGAEAERLDKWLQAGGVLIRFAGPRSAAHPDSFLPVALLQGDRALGGALSWSKPAHMAPFPANSPFAGLSVPEEVLVNRQVLADPAPDIAQHVWASLTDGTPLVTFAARGAGKIVLFHVTANADWSNLPLSGLFVDMLRRLVALSAGIPAAQGNTMLAPAQTLDGFGQLGAPPPTATALAANAFGRTPVSPQHPPGLYGPENNRQALNLGGSISALAASAPVPGARIEPLGRVLPERALAPALIAAAVIVLALDLFVSLGLRGLLRLRRVATLAALLAVCSFSAHAAEGAADKYPSLGIHLAYVITGDPQIDQISRMGLQGLSEYVNQRTAAELAEPVAVAPAQDDLSFYPLLYWPISTEAPPLSARALAALNDYMARGGIILIDTRGGGSGEDFNPGANAVLMSIGKVLNIPPLVPLTTDHVLARAFYLLREFPGRYTGSPVWVQRDQDRANDSVSPVIIGANDWAAAWAVDSEGRNVYAVIPGGARQRLLAYRFGVNLVMYALTGNYKGDQVHIPAILERLGQ